MKKILFLFLYLSSFVVWADEGVLEFNKVKTLEIINSSGVVTVTGADDGEKVRVKIKKIRAEEGCDLYAGVESDTLTIEQRAPEKNRNSCETNIEVKTPNKDDLNLVVEISKGEINLNTFAGDIDLKAKSGDINVSRGFITRGKLVTERGKVKIQNGKIEEGFIRVEEGNVLVSFDDIFEKGRLEIQNQDGDVQIEVPAGKRIDTQVEAKSGRIVGTGKDNSIKNSQGFVFDLIVPKGNFTVKRK